MCNWDWVISNVQAQCSTCTLYFTWVWCSANVNFSFRDSTEMPSLDVVHSSSLEDFTSHHYGHLPPWEKRLVAAQSILFNKELFTMVSYTYMYTVLWILCGHLVFFFFLYLLACSWGVWSKTSSSVWSVFEQDQCPCKLLSHRWYSRNLR